MSLRASEYVPKLQGEPQMSIKVHAVKKDSILRVHEDDQGNRPEPVSLSGD